jgi:hypothetical protein
MSEPTIQVDDSDGIEQLMDALEDQGYLNGIERPKVEVLYITWGLKKKG